MGWNCSPLSLALYASLLVICAMALPKDTRGNRAVLNGSLAESTNGGNCLNQEGKAWCGMVALSYRHVIDLDALMG